MKKVLLITLALMAANLVFAQDVDPNSWMQSEGSLEGFVVGNQYFTFVSDANLREKPNTSSTVVTKLPIATSVEILSVTTDSFMLRGVKLPWVQVQTKTAGKPSQKGFLWGGFLALACIQTPVEEYMPNSGVQYLTGVTAYDEDKHQISVQVRAAKDNVELSKCEFTTNGDLSYYPSFEVLSSYFPKVKAVLSVNYYYPSCGYPSGNNLLFWQENNQMVKVLETSSVSDGGVFYDSEEFILPSQRGGIGDHILVTHDHSEFEEKGEEMVRTVQKFGLVLYKWTGTKLMKVRELK